MGSFFVTQKTNENISESSRDRISRVNKKWKKYKLEMQNIMDLEMSKCEQLLIEAKRDIAVVILKKIKYQQNLLNKARHSIQDKPDPNDVAFPQYLMYNIWETGCNTSFISMDVEIYSTNTDIMMLSRHDMDSIKHAIELNQILSKQLTDEDDEEVWQQLEQIEKRIYNPIIIGNWFRMTVHKPISIDNIINIIIEYF